MADLIAREFEAIFRCYNELLKNDSTDSAASINRAALIFQLKLIFTVSCLLPILMFELLHSSQDIMNRFGDITEREIDESVPKNNK
jgi:hypothetical protein